jgi:hypothetical protein
MLARIVEPFGEAVDHRGQCSKAVAVGNWNTLAARTDQWGKRKVVTELIRCEHPNHAFLLHRRNFKEDGCGHDD